MATTAAKEVGGGGGRGGVEDVEEGEISDTASVEEISEEDFNKHGEEPEVTVVKETPATTKRVWTMSDLYKYQMTGKGYVSGLYNLAWAQAALNKPLNELLVEVVDPAEAAKRSSPASSSSSVGGEKKVEKVVIDDDSGGEDDVKIVDVEREEGELEEGEIDLESEGPAGVPEGSGDGMHVDGGGVEGKKVGLEERVKSVREALESVTVVEVEKSFEEGCAKVQMVLENLRELVQENDVPGKDALVQLLITAVQAVNSVFNSMNRNLKEKNKEIFSRLLSLVNSYYSTRFSPEQIKELEMMVISVDASDTLPSTKLGETEREREGFIAMNDNDDKDTLAKSAVHPVLTDNLCASVEPLAQNKVNTLVEASKSGASSFRSRGPLPPLLDLHKDHDLDSLPSPTRESAPSLPVQRVPPVGDEISKFVSPLPKVDASESRMHPYETDAVKAVSSYQQRFGRSSFFMADRLPSPTPSEDSADGNGDSGGEISSSSSAGNSNPPVLGKSVVSPLVPGPEGSGLAGVIPAKNTLPMSSVSSLNVKPSAKSRDPRLRFMNSDPSTLGQNHSSLPTLNNMPKLEPRKNKVLDDPPMDGPSLKRHRIASESSLMDMKAVNESGGWLEDSDMIVPPTRNGNNLGRNAVSDPRRVDNDAPVPVTGSVTSQASVSVNEHVPVPVIGTIGASRQVLVAGTAVTSLPELLKNIAVNPTMLMNILKMGQQQQKLASEDNNITDPAKNSTLPLSSSSIVAAGHVSTVAPSQPAILPRPAIMPQPSQSDSVDEVGKIRMKPRDPRRVLHNNTQQRTGNMGPDPLKSNVTPLSTAPVIMDNQIVQKQEGFADTKLTPSQPSALPDISSSFTKSLKNLADIVSVSQGSSTQPLVSQNPASQPMPVRADRLDGKVVSSNAEQTKGTVSTPELAAAAAAHSQSTWADVEHLFEGYDDQQKAAIQRERARRIEEQKKMFAVRKLCLVLDLDHTLLNSAKFAEVDPVHDEVLRKKEEQDREKPYRHLFRFPHMGMWTKLRPGIWNFLERASKLYELHLYTMGNKLYATEMAKVLDPKGVLFAGRVISRGDDGDPFDSDERVPKSKDLEGVLGMESSVVIIDDSVRVWPHNKLNLIVVERYIYFPCSRRQFGLPGPSLLEIDHDERPEDGTLACSLAVIEKIHQNFYNHQSLEEADVRNILALEQRKILAGCRIVFSRVFPVGEANPHLHPLWQTAEQFGAVCTNQIDEQVTHVVANSLGTDKVNWALSNGKFVVHPGWVEASALLYRRANEQDFAIKP